MVLITGFEDHSEVGRQLSRAPDQEVKMTILSDALADKATSTLRSRATALNGFWSWCRTRGTDPSPMVEATVYEYCKYCQATGSAPTKVNSLRSAILFASHVLGWIVQKTLLDSRRIAGVAYSELQRLPPVKRREALEPGFVLHLAKITCSDVEEQQNRLIASFFLFLILTRARFSDGMSVKEEPVITQKGRWVEATVQEYKTSKAKGRRGRDLPLVAPARLGKLPWAEEWLACRESLGCKVGNGEPLLPLFVNGVKTTAGWTNAEANEALRHLLAKAKEDQVIKLTTIIADHGTHSCKRTTLHWVSVAGLPLDERRLLGHHVIRADGSWMAYARDALSALMDKYEEVVKRVFRAELKVLGVENLGIPEPEAASQSSTVAEPSDQDRPEVHQHEELSESSDGETADSSDAETGALAARTLKLRNAILKDEVNEDEGDYEPWIHKKIGTIHVRPRRATSDMDKFLCGRPVTDKFDKAGAWSMIPKCHTCFAGIPERDVW